MVYFACAGGHVTDPQGIAEKRKKRGRWRVKKMSNLFLSYIQSCSLRQGGLPQSHMHLEHNIMWKKLLISNSSYMMTAFTVALMFFLSADSSDTNSSLIPNILSSLTTQRSANETNIFKFYCKDDALPTLLETMEPFVCMSTCTLVRLWIMCDRRIHGVCILSVHTDDEAFTFCLHTSTLQHLVESNVSINMFLESFVVKTLSLFVRGQRTRGIQHLEGKVCNDWSNGADVT